MSARVLLVDDVDELRSVVGQALRLRGGFQVVAEAADGRTAIKLSAVHQPDIVVLDLGLPDLAGREVLTGLRRVSPGAQIVIFSGTHTPDREALARTAEGFARKEWEVRYLVELLTGLASRTYHAARRGLGGEPADVAAARRFLTEKCAAWGCDTITDDALIVLSELVTNAILHAGSTFDVRVAFAGQVLRIEVTDHGSGTPDVKAPRIEDTHGRGLVLVNALSAAWGVEMLRDGKTVWAEFDLRAPRPRRPQDRGARAREARRVPDK